VFVCFECSPVETSSLIFKNVPRLVNGDLQKIRLLDIIQCSIIAAGWWNW